MRMRKKHNLDSRIEKCPGLLVKEPAENRGAWRSFFPNAVSVCLEIGCGKGRFTLETAQKNPDTFFIALEKVADAMIIAMERIRDAGVKNVLFINGDAAKIGEMFAPGEIDRIYINFCDPWPKSSDAKFRLTAPNFLRSYCSLLPEGGEIHFKTDNAPLFDWSVDWFNKEGWALSELTHDLHANGICGVMTDYEAKFYAEGLKINRLVATRSGTTKSLADGLLPRLHNSALTDARGYAESKRSYGETVG